MSVSSSKTLDEYTSIYLDTLRNDSYYSSDEEKSSVKNLEFEVKFGTGSSKKDITKFDNDNVTNRILSNGFVLKSTSNLLRIYPNRKPYRVEINGMDKIISYCKSNKLEVDPSTKKLTGAFIIKKNALVRINKEDRIFTEIKPYDYADFNFKMSLKTEENIEPEDIEGLTKKFRFMNRNTFIHKDPNCPLQIDISVIKTAESTTFIDSNIMNARPASYEIEIELLNDVSVKMEMKKIASYLRNTIKLIISGFQNSNFPISTKEEKDTVNEYMRLIWGPKHRDNIKILPKHFMGPSSFTLQIQNIIEIDKPVNLSSNIRYDYTVTEKADGERKLLFINQLGKLYFINTNMNIQFTGILTTDNSLFNTIIDGEHITHNKENKYINLYAAFDIYYLNSQDVRRNQFSRATDSESLAEKGRLEILGETIDLITASTITVTGSSSYSKSGVLRLTVKKFYPESPDQSIFDCCALLIDKKDSYEYNTDGLIFTPRKMAVGQLANGVIPTEPEKRGWEFSLKWKPPEFNTIDFLATTKKAEGGKDFIGYVNDLRSSDELKKYKTLELRVGFDEKQHGYINPFQTLIDGTVTEKYSDSYNEDVGGYRPVKFYPTNPTIENAYICNIMLTDNDSVENAMISEEGELIEDKMIIECRYDNDNNDGWKWIPLRVRYDKTAEYRNRGRNFGNPYHVANSNWHTIHHPISIDMLRTGSGITPIEDEEVYYKKTTANNTRGLRDFHNMFVKSKLLRSVSKPNSILIDYAVGKGGDLPKWISSRIKFVFGMDISLDNIQNRIDGACARFLEQLKRMNKNRNNNYNLAALFVAGDSSKNIRNTDATKSDKFKQIINAVMGKGIRDEKTLGRGVYKHWGIGANGFDVSSIQFAIHYMFKNMESLLGFMRNVSENTKVGGYFVGTCYDGETVFNKLVGKNKLTIYTDDSEKDKIWEIVKKYEENTFQNDKSSLGYEISVFQESIGSYFSEYLVNFKFLDNILQQFGFVRLNDAEARQLDLPSGTGMFDLLFNKMNEENMSKSGQNLTKNITMTNEEKKISFLNRYFVYLKRSTVDSGKVERMLLSSSVLPEPPITLAPATIAAPITLAPATIAAPKQTAPITMQMPTKSQQVETKEGVTESKAPTMTRPREKEVVFGVALIEAYSALNKVKTSKINLEKVSEGGGGAAPSEEDPEPYRIELRNALKEASSAINRAIQSDKSKSYKDLLSKASFIFDKIQIPSRRLTNTERRSMESELEKATDVINTIKELTGIIFPEQSSKILKTKVAPVVVSKPFAPIKPSSSIAPIKPSSSVAPVSFAPLTLTTTPIEATPPPPQKTPKDATVPSGTSVQKTTRKLKIKSKISEK
jgi:hypothetical protein